MKMKKFTSQDFPYITFQIVHLENKVILEAYGYMDEKPTACIEVKRTQYDFSADIMQAAAKIAYQLEWVY